MKEFLLSSYCSNHEIFYKQIKKVKEKLEIIDQDRYAAVVVRARSERFWMGEAPTKRSLSDEKSYAVEKEIKQICHPNTVTSDSAQIAGAFVDHYNNLFGKKLQVEEGFKTEFSPLMAKQVDDVKAELEAPISISEIEQAIAVLTTGKSPGPDGLLFTKCAKAKLQLLYIGCWSLHTKKTGCPPRFAGHTLFWCQKPGTLFIYFL